MVERDPVGFHEPLAACVGQFGKHDFVRPFTDFQGPEVGFGEVAVVVLLLFRSRSLGNASCLHEVTGLHQDLLAPADHVPLPRDLEGERLLDTLVRGDVLAFHSIVPFERDVRIDPD